MSFIPTLQVGLLGYGYIAEVHARAALNHPGATLKAVSGRDPKRCQAFASRHGIEAIKGGVDELVQRPDIDAVIICTPNALHARESLTALEAGKHVLVEKPMATSVTDAEAMKAAALKHRRQLMVGHMWRFDREAKWLRQALTDGAIGEPVRTHGWGVHVNWGPSGWFTNPTLAGGGALVDMGVHAIDTARYLLGDPDPTSVFARVETRYGDYEVDDTAHVMITWDSGALSTIESGWWHPAAGGPEASTEIFGTSGYGRLFPTEVRIGLGEHAVTMTPEASERVTHCDPHIYEQQLAAFLDSCATGCSIRPAADDGLVIMRICEAAYESSERQQVITL